MSRIGAPGLVPGPMQPEVFVRPLPPGPQPADVALLAPAERRRLEQFARARDAGAFAAGRALIRRAASARLGCRAGDVPIDAPPWGPPRVTGSDLACSVAHGGDVVVAAVVDRGAVGVDVEPVDAGLAPEEAAWIAEHVLGVPGGELCPAPPARQFLARWTLAEAVLKALGTGLGADPREVRIDLRGAPRLLAAPGIAPSAASSWRLELFEPAPGHLAALAVSADAGPPRIERLA